MKKGLLLLVLLLVAAGAGWWFFLRNPSHTPEFLSTPIQRGELTQIVTSTGTLKPVVNVTVGCQISGTISELKADFNSPVQEGQILARLDSATYQAIVLQAEGELASARASLELAEVTAKRKEELVRENAAPKADLDTAKAALHQAQATVQIKEASLKKAQVDLARCTIYSPISGLVISRNVDVGQTVAASLSAPTLFTIADDMRSMQIDASVSEADVGAVAEGQTVEFTVDAFPYSPFYGRVQQIRNSPVTVQNVVTYDVIVEVSNPELKLKPGMTANVSITVAQRKDALLIPNAALRFRPPDTLLPVTPSHTSSKTPPTAGPVPAPPQANPSPTSPKSPKTTSKSSRANRPERKAYILRPGSLRPEPVPLKLGITDNLHTEVLEGLAEGDTVLTGLKNPIPPSTPSASSNPLGAPAIRR